MPTNERPITMKALLAQHVPLREQGDLVATMRRQYDGADGMGPMTIGELCKLYDLSRPTVTKALRNPDWNCPYPPAKVRKPGRPSTK